MSFQGFSNVDVPSYGAGFQGSANPAFAQCGGGFASPGMPSGGGPPYAPPEEFGKRVVFVPLRRSRMCWVSILVSLFIPWILFTFLFWVMIFEVHYTQPTFAYCLVLAGFGFSASLEIVAQLRLQRDADPSWYRFCAIACFLSTAAAGYLGNYIFWSSMHDYYDFRTLNTYSSINPAREKGQMVMDAGRIYFGDGTKLDQGKTIGFKHKDTYCVVPITAGNDKLPNYDFWAVGKDCCQHPGKFHCGKDSQNFKARSGLRLMREEDRPWYRLAVQQAEAAYGISAAHPVFFTWTQDPMDDIIQYKFAGWKWFVIGTCTHAMTNFCSVMFATFAFSKFGRHLRSGRSI